MQLPLTTTVPERHIGQRSVLGFQAAPMPVVRVAFVGLGERGLKAVQRFLTIEHARIAALCDAERSRVDRVCQLLSAASCPQPLLFAGKESYRELLKCADIDLIYICTDWESHVGIAVDSMKAGRHVAIEVPAATTLEDCWKLVDTAELSQRHCTMLENCCYDNRHLATLAAARRGRMGTIVHVEGGYIHPIDGRWTPWRIAANKSLRGDLYPTHGMGPACQLLGIHRSDRIETIVGIDTAAFKRADFRNGDHTTTIMRTRKGKTILLQHNVVCPHSYTRRYHVVGTLQSVDTSESTSHDIMSRRMDRRLVDRLHRGLPLDIDVYDVAEWCAVSELSRVSIEHGNVPVAFPDFTRNFAKIST